MTACHSNCGCAYDGGDCCAKTVKGGKVNTEYWFVYCTFFVVKLLVGCNNVESVHYCVTRMINQRLQSNYSSSNVNTQTAMHASVKTPTAKIKSAMGAASLRITKETATVTTRTSERCGYVGLACFRNQCRVAACRC